MGNTITCCHPWYNDEDSQKIMREKGVQTNIEIVAERVASPTGKEWDFVANEKIKVDDKEAI